MRGGALDLLHARSEGALPSGAALNALHFHDGAVARLRHCATLEARRK
jgi:hypothetical protein